jgi:hypothetical protein
MHRHVFALLAAATVAQCDQGAWAQCGGIGWSGDTTCVSGYSCVYSNDYYSQCIPGSRKLGVGLSTRDPGLTFLRRSAYLSCYDLSYYVETGPDIVCLSARKYRRRDRYWSMGSSIFPSKRRPGQTLAAGQGQYRNRYRLG